jgi:hypothetical protein
VKFPGFVVTCSIPRKENYFSRLSKIAKSDYQLHHACLSVGPSFRTEQLGYQVADFNEILYLSIFRKSAEKIKEYQVMCMKANILYIFL